MRIKFISFLVVFLLLISCAAEKVTVVNEHINLVITPDLSNRIEEKYSKPVSDIDLINSIYSNYYPDIYKIKNRVMGQKDRIQFRFTNPSIINEFKINLENLSMDLRGMTPKERINYLANGGNKNELSTLDSEIKNIYQNALSHTTGGDVYNYFKKEISSSVLEFTEKPKQIDEITLINKHRNIIVLLTDGYIEAGLYGKENCIGEKCYYLSKTRVDKFRKAFLASGNNNLKDFFMKSGYGIVPLENKNLEHIEVFVAEMYDRSLNKKTGSQTVSPNDSEIMTIFWSDWLVKSGVKHFKLLSIINSKEEFLTELKKFISEK
jgi:hypothetical protein